jgi:hypothetical protein
MTNRRHIAQLNSVRASEPLDSPLLAGPERFCVGWS